VLGDVVAAGADRVAGSTVVAEDGGVAVQAGKIIILAAVRSQCGAVKNVVGLVGSVPCVSPKESGSDWERLVYNVLSESSWSKLTGFTGRRAGVNAGGHKRASTRSSENITNHMRTF